MHCGCTSRCPTSSSLSPTARTTSMATWRSNGSLWPVSTSAVNEERSAKAWALTWTDVVTAIAADHARAAVYQEVQPRFSEKDLPDLKLAVEAINAGGSSKTSMATSSS